MLITLAIIGIIAALTVPTLMRKYQEHQTVVAVKTAHSILNNAYKLAVIENGLVTTWDIGEKDSDDGSLKVRDYFTKYLKTIPFNGEDKYSTSIKMLHETAQLQYTTRAWKAAKLQNGMIILFWSGGNGNGIGLLADVNGLKGPNIVGRDIFGFSTTKERSAIYPSANSNNCSLTSWKSELDNGKSCTAWVLYKGNLDYLRRDVSSEWPTN